jgi:MoaA/NifB/PqqE/SkfB family radical SAM enzyme
MPLAGESVSGDVGDSRDRVLALKADGDTRWCLRDDVRRVVIYELTTETEDINKCGLLHPTEAVILALFDGERTIADVDCRVEYLFEVDATVARTMVDNLLKRWKEALQEGKPPGGNIYDPAKFVIPADQVDLQTPRLYKPLSLNCHLSDDCMRHCIYCNVQKARTQDLNLLPLARWEQLAEECAELEMPCLTLAGGDPFMRPDMERIIGFFLRRGLHPFLVTKSLIRPDRAQRLAEMGIRRMQISMDAPVPYLADMLTGSHGFFAEVTASIRNLTAAGIIVRVNSVITHFNVRQVPRLIDLLFGLGISTISLTCFARSLYLSEEENADLFPDANDRQWLEGMYARRSAEERHRVHLQTPKDSSEYSVEEKYIRFPERPVCSAGRWGLIVRSDGKVTLCDELPPTESELVGDLSHQSLMEVWRSQRLDELVSPSRKKFVGTVCYDCEDFDRCHQDRGRCVRDALKAYGQFYAPVPDCPRAPTAPRLN